MTDNRRVRLVSYHFGNPGSPAFPRVDFLAGEMRRRGYQVTVYTSGGEARTDDQGVSVVPVVDPLTRFKPQAGAGGNSIVSPGGKAPVRKALVTVARTLYHRFTFPDPQIFWSNKVARIIGNQTLPGDITVTFSSPESVGNVGVRTQERGGYWWFDFADGWTFQGLRYDALNNQRRKKKEELLERTWVAAADGVSTVNDTLVTFFNGLRSTPDVALYPNLVPRQLVESDFRAAPFDRTQPMTVLYFGRLRQSDAHRSLAPLIAQLAAIQTPAIPAIRFLFCGEFTLEDQNEMSILSKYASVEMLSPIKREQLPTLIAEYDINVALVINSPGIKGSTSKLLDGIGLALPTWLFADRDSESALIVEGKQLGAVVYNAEEPPPLAITIAALGDSAMAEFTALSGQWWDGAFQAARLADRLEAFP